MARSLDTRELPYRVESVEMIAETPTLRVSVLRLAPGQEVPWHYHSHVTDSFFCLSGPMQAEHGSAENRVVLNPGDAHEVPPRTQHRVRGLDGGACRFLIVQGVGAYDFVPSAPRGAGEMKGS